ncbi:MULTISPECIES: ABC transporter ATP-binding protein [unclassified Microbacterium]|uniref:ABC transporter ATP-binding protein n=1 Tax=unclassified Microbacterium TaxID=2609290 RepID=UPI00097F50C5|nr:ABC transporter ATP-binding protein [Microbacterium sp. JB110]SJM54621.1 Branched-chain amino acid transport ATP-binding protein LivF (TC 3.A.1.4.1) [Frigoribacterium sp. JB110]
MASDVVLELSDIEAGYGKAALVLRGLSVKVRRKEVVCLVGPNGAGKSTVLKVASGMLKPRSGKVLLGGEDVTGRGPQKLLRGGLSHVLQGHSVFKEMTVEENIRLGGYALSDQSAIAERIDFVRTVFPVVAEQWKQSAGALSGGQQKQVEFARAMIVQPDVVLLDEPSMGLDPKRTATIFEEVDRMRQNGVAVLIVEQNARRALQMADVGCVLDLGRVFATGPASELLADPKLSELYLGGRPAS